LGRPGGGPHHRQHLPDRQPDLAGKGRAVRFGEGLRVVLGFLRQHRAVDQHAGHLHLARWQAVGFGQPLDLRDDDAARIVHRHRDGQ